MKLSMMLACGLATTGMAATVTVRCNRINSSCTTESMLATRQAVQIVTSTVVVSEIVAGATMTATVTSPDFGAGQIPAAESNSPEFTLTEPIMVTVTVFPNGNTFVSVPWPTLSSTLTPVTLSTEVPVATPFLESSNSVAASTSVDTFITSTGTSTSTVLTTTDEATEMPSPSETEQANSAAKRGLGSALAAIVGLMGLVLGL